MYSTPFGSVKINPGLRLVIIALILAVLQPTPLLIVTGEPRTVVTTYPKLGTHTRLTDEVEPWKIQRTLQLVREMGSPWIVEFFPWAYYHSASGEFAWEHPDLVVEHAVGQGLTIIARLGLTPEWARPPGTTLSYLEEDSYRDFAEFAAAFSERYRGKVEYIIVWNEPNLSYEWGYQNKSYQDYVALLKIVYPAVKAANPNMNVLAGALAPTIEPEGSPWGLNDLEFLRGMYAFSAADYFDGLAVHAYGLSFPPEMEPGESLLNFRRVELVREIMVENNDAMTPIYITEAGWNDHPRWTRAVRPAQRIQYTLEALKYAEEKWPFVKMTAIWAFRYPAPTQSYSDYFTLVSPEFIEKPIYSALREFSGGKSH